MNPRSILLGGLSLLHGALCAAPLDQEWQAVAKALDDKQPQTALPLLKPLETAAFKRKAWGDGTKALLIRVRLENGLGWAGTLDDTQSARRSQWTPDPFAADPFADAAAPDLDDEEEPPAGVICWNGAGIIFHEAAKKVAERVVRCSYEKIPLLFSQSAPG
ncbi:MAG: hypothetical protein K9M97_13145, partial [Akkermansiaceae bacterium]|nr:hypothetical protein [Akkermansiaceae bacterium]